MVLREQALATIRHTFYLCSKLHFAHNRAINIKNIWLNASYECWAASPTKLMFLYSPTFYTLSYVLMFLCLKILTCTRVFCFLCLSPTNCNMPNTISKSLYICCGKSMKIRNTRSETVPPIILQSLLGERGARRSMFPMPRH